ncbi:PilN domain-containing protein [Entomohabitans teleogrylli]|uniref:PilN domain-containing protein n=1 Tax=Entomohabitans teleogrylli TaxID=1384589 RepID=UPI00073D9D68|nr:PilN domain-containing protein [Entomohabitans teleogrylli]
MSSLVNLLPWRASRRQARYRQTGAAGAALLVVVALVLWQRWAGWSLALRQQESMMMHYQHLRQGYGNAIAQRAREVEQLKSLERQAERQQAARDAVNRWQGELTQLAQQMPADVWLTTLSASEQQLILTGLGASDSSILILETALGRLGYNHVSLETLQREASGKWLWRLRLRRGAAL